MAEEIVDTRLAVVYIPVVTGISKTAAATILFYVARTQSTYFASVLLFTLCITAKCLHHEYLIDTSGMLVSSCTALIINAYRYDFGTEHAHMVLVPLNIGWSFMGGYALLYPDNAERFQRYIIIGCAVLFFVHSQIWMDEESIYMAALRLILFQGMSLVYMYVLNLSRLRGSCVEDFFPCVIRFSPLLFVPPMLLYVLSLVYVGIIFYIFKSKECKSSDAEAPLMAVEISPADSSFSIEAYPTQIGRPVPSSVEPEPEVMEMFRKAKQKQSV